MKPCQSTETSARAKSAPAGPASLWELFLTITLVAVQSFGGPLAVIERSFVDDKGWMTRDEFVDLLVLAQSLPGPYVASMAVMTGDRYFGVRGALTALAAMLVLPLLILSALIVFYEGIGDNAAIAGALRGITAVAAGMIFGAAVKLSGNIGHNPVGPAVWIGVAVGVFAAAVFAKVALVWILPCFGIPSVLWCWVRLVRAQQR